MAADPGDADLVIAGGVALYRSTDGGLTFTQIGAGVHRDHHDATWDPAGADLWVATDGGMWRSSDGGTTWLARSDGLVTYQLYDICLSQPNANLFLGSAQDHGYDRYVGSTEWDDALGGALGTCAFHDGNGTTVYATDQLGVVWKSASSGAPGSWLQTTSGLTGSGAWIVPVDSDPREGAHVYTATSAGVFRTTNGGNLWTNVAAHAANWISMSPLDGDIVWTIGGAVWSTTDDGASWTQAAPFDFPTGPGTKILAHPTVSSAALATFGSYGTGVAHVALTTDGGASWSDVTGDLPSHPVNAIAVDSQAPDRWYIGTDLGVWVTENGGARWVPYEIGLPNTVVVDLEIQDSTRRLRAGTHGRGAWEIDITPPLTTEAPLPAPGPIQLLLDPPSPNPVRRGTMLRYAARHEGPVTLAIYDVHGRRVGEVARHGRGDGVVRQVEWNAADVPSGVYFVVLTAGSDRKSRRLVVAR